MEKQTGSLFLEREANEAFKMSVIDIQPRLYGFIFKRLLNVDASQDVLQETNLVIWRKSDEFTHGTSFSAWAFKIAHFQVLAHLQKNRKKVSVVDEEILDELMETENRKDDIFEARSKALSSCLDKLGNKSRELINARYDEGGAVKKMAREMGKTVNAISKALQKIRHQLFDCIENQVKGV